MTVGYHGNKLGYFYCSDNVTYLFRLNKIPLTEAFFGN